MMELTSGLSDRKKECFNNVKAITAEISWNVGIYFVLNIFRQKKETDMDPWIT